MEGQSEEGLSRPKHCFWICLLRDKYLYLHRNRSIQRYHHSNKSIIDTLSCFNYKSSGKQETNY